MPWAKLDDRAPSNPKVFEAGVCAFGLFTQSLCYCAANLTDGFVPATALPLVSPGTSPRLLLALVDRLVKAGLWAVDDERGGWVVHDYLDYNPSRADVLAEREAARKRKDVWNAKRNGGRTPTERRKNADGTDGGTAEELFPDPTRPDPTPTPLSHTSREAAASTQGAVAFRIPERITKTLDRCPKLGAVPRLRTPEWWQAQVRARPAVDFPAQVLEAEAWLRSNPKKAPRSDFPAFLNRWLRKAADEAAEER